MRGPSLPFAFRTIHFLRGTSETDFSFTQTHVTIRKSGCFFVLFFRLWWFFHGNHFVTLSHFGDFKADPEQLEYKKCFQNHHLV